MTMALEPCRHHRRVTGHVLGNETLQNLPRGSGPALVYKCCRGPSVSCDRVENQLRRKTKVWTGPWDSGRLPQLRRGPHPPELQAQ